MYETAALNRLLQAELSFKYHLDAITTQVIQPLKGNFNVLRKLHPKTTLAGLIQIAHCRNPLYSIFKQILDRTEPETFESDSELCIRQYAEYVDILIESIKDWSRSGLPQFFVVWSRQRTNVTVRQALIDTGNFDAAWNLILQPKLNWKNKSIRLDILSTCLLPFSVVSELILRVDQIRVYLHTETESAQLALLIRNKMEALNNYLQQQSNTKELIRQIRILAIEYLIHDCPTLLADQFRKFEKVSIFQFTMGTEKGWPENVVLVAFNDILIWADSETKTFIGGVYRANSNVSEDRVIQNSICLQINSTKTIVKLQSLDNQQHGEWIRYLNPAVASTGPIQLERHHSLLNKYPAQTLPVEVRLRRSDDFVVLSDEILVHDGDHPSKLAYLFSCRHRLNRALTNELCSRLRSIAESRCQDIQARRRLYLKQHQE